MNKIPGHSLPKYSDACRENALFHYTTADGLNGIFQTGEIWSTAYYCTNDESELATGKGILTPLFTRKSHELIEARDQRLKFFQKGPLEALDQAEKFEQLILSFALSSLCAYITCFCKPNNKEEFYHGLLSQWRGYGGDGGYALQFDREKLLKQIEIANKSDKYNYELQDVYYDNNNPLKEKVLEKQEAFVNAYVQYFDEIDRPIGELIKNNSISNPIASLLGGPLEAYLEYLVQTKNKHFSEEQECRLSLVQVVQHYDGCLPVDYFNRNGLLVPYIKTPKSSFNVIDCVEWIIIGPSPRLEARIKSINQLVKRSGRDIKVRPSHIPYTKL